MTMAPKIARGMREANRNDATRYSILQGRRLAGLQSDAGGRVTAGVLHGGEALLVSVGLAGEGFQQEEDKDVLPSIYSS